MQIVRKKMKKAQNYKTQVVIIRNTVWLVVKINSKCYFKENIFFWLFFYKNCCLKHVNMPVAAFLTHKYKAKC